MNHSSYRPATQIIEDIMTTPVNSTVAGENNPLYQFRQDQILEPSSAQEDKFVTFDGYKIYLAPIWPFSNPVIPLDDLDWLLDMWDATQAPGVGAVLFTLHKQHKMMDSVPQYLANPAFMQEYGDILKTTLRSFINGRMANDVMYRYQRLLQTHPIMFETMSWLEPKQQNLFGTKLYKFGIPNALPFIDPETLTPEMIHEAIQSAKANASKRLVPPSESQYLEMYRMLLEYNGQDLVNETEVVYISNLNWNLGFQYIKLKNLDFNTALSIAMTFIYNRESSISPYENVELIKTVYEHYGPSDQWPTLDHVVKYVNAVTGGRTKVVQSDPPASVSGSTLSGHGRATKEHVFE